MVSHSSTFPYWASSHQPVSRIPKQGYPSLLTDISSHAMISVIFSCRKQQAIGKKKREPLWPTCPANLPHLQGLWTHWTIDNLLGSWSQQKPSDPALQQKFYTPLDRLTCFKPENQRKRRWCFFVKKPIIFNFHVKLWGLYSWKKDYREKKWKKNTHSCCVNLASPLGLDQPSAAKLVTVLMWKGCPCWISLTRLPHVSLSSVRAAPRCQ